MFPDFSHILGWSDLYLLYSTMSMSFKVLVQDVAKHFWHICLLHSATARVNAVYSHP
jgi:hypothetical protein